MKEQFMQGNNFLQKVFKSVKREAIVSIKYNVIMCEYIMSKQRTL